MAGTYIGLDFGSYSIKAVELSGKGDDIKLTGAHIMPMPAEAMMDGTIFDYSEIAGELSKLMQMGGFTALPIALSIKGTSTIARYARVPYISPEQLERDLLYLVPQYMKLDLEEFAVDYKIENLNETSFKAEVVFSATRKENIADYMSVLESAKLSLREIDLEPLALVNLYNFLGLPRDATSMIVHVGDTSITSIILHDGIFRHVEYGTSGGRHWITQLVNMGDIPAEHAELIKDTPEEQPERETIIKITTENYIPDLIRDVEVCFSNYKYLGGNAPERIYLSGGGATTYGLKDALENYFNASVALMSPDSVIEIINPAAQQIFAVKPTVFNVAIAMALR